MAEGEALLLHPAAAKQLLNENQGIFNSGEEQEKHFERQLHVSSTPEHELRSLPFALITKCVWVHPLRREGQIIYADKHPHMHSYKFIHTHTHLMVSPRESDRRLLLLFISFIHSF